MSKFEHVLVEARKDYDSGMNADAFSNKYFAKGSPFLPADEAEMAEYLASPELEAIQELIEKASEEQERFSGKISLRIPKSLHRSLVAEAEREGTSLNQLCLAKLARPL